MAETSTIFGFMKYVSATDILSDFKKTVDSHFVNSLKEAHKVPLLDECCPCIAFFKGPRVTMASSALQGFIRCQPNVPRLYCIYIIPHKPKHNFKLFSFNNIINPILDYQLRLNQIVYLYTQVLLTPNTIHTITFLLNIL